MEILVYAGVEDVIAGAGDAAPLTECLPSRLDFQQALHRPGMLTLHI